MPTKKNADPATTQPDRRRLLGAGLAGFGLSLWPFGALRADGALTFFRIGTGPTAETLYSLGTAISAGISRPPGSSPCDEGGICGVPGLIAVAQSRSGSISGIQDLKNGLLDSALVHSDMAYWAHKGGGPFGAEGQVEDLRVIADLLPVSMHIIVRADSGIMSIRDLAGRTISKGTMDSGTPRFVDVMLRFHGIEENDIHAVYLQHGSAADQLIAGDIDALFAMGGAPMDAVDELTEEMDIRFLPVEPTVLHFLRGFFPFLVGGEIPGNAYRGYEAVSTVNLGVQWVVRENQDAELVEAITRALWQGTTAELFNLNNPGHVFPTVEQGRPGRLVPMHPGARAYYESLADHPAETG